MLANGFGAIRWLHLLTIYGRDGRSLHDVSSERGGPQPYMGTAMDDFPIFFIIMGLNTANGHSSLKLGSENIVEYILEIIKPVLSGDALNVVPKEQAEIQ